MNKKYILFGYGVLGIMFLMANTSKSNNTNPPKTDGNKYLPEGYKQGDALPTNYRPGALKMK